MPRDRKLPATRTPDASHIGILLLAGGKATRLPNKLELDVGGTPLIGRVHANLTNDGLVREVVLACSAANASRYAEIVPARGVVDRWPALGPLGGILSGFGAMRSTLIFVAAGDAPNLDMGVIKRLLAAWRDDDECVVPRCTRGTSAQLEPLAALYDRVAFLREGEAVRRSGRGAVHAVIERLRARVVEYDDPRIFANVNTPADYAALRADLGRRGRGIARVTQ